MVELKVNHGRIPLHAARIRSYLEATDYPFDCLFKLELRLCSGNCCIAKKSRKRPINFSIFGDIVHAVGRMFFVHEALRSGALLALQPA